MAAGAGIRREQIRGFGLRAGEVTPGTLDPSVYGGVPTSIDPDDTGAAGVAVTLSRSDHGHAITTGTPAGLTLTAISAESAGTGFARDVHVHATSALPWGIVARQQLTANSTGFTATGASDFALTDVAVNAARLYKVVLHSNWTTNGADARWILRFQVDAGAGFTDVLTLDELDAVAGATTGTVNGVAYWEPATGTPDLRVLVDEITGTSTLNLNASATTPRQFWVEDIGPR